MKGFASKHTELKVDCYKTWKIYCLQSCVCTFQPGNFTGLGSEGVNGHGPKKIDLKVTK